MSSNNPKNTEIKPKGAEEVVKLTELLAVMTPSVGRQRGAEEEQRKRLSARHPARSGGGGEVGKQPFSTRRRRRGSHLCPRGKEEGK